jgi:hypothetical protein
MNRKKWKTSVRYAFQDGVVKVIQNATSNYALLTQLQERTDFFTSTALEHFSSVLPTSFLKYLISSQRIYLCLEQEAGPY